MTLNYIALVGYLILTAGAVIIFSIVGYHHVSDKENIRDTLAQQLPAADVNYLLSTESVDVNNPESIIHLAHRIQNIRSPFIKYPGIENVEILVVVSLLIMEQRVNRQRSQRILKWLLSAIAIFVFANVTVILAIFKILFSLT